MAPAKPLPTRQLGQNGPKIPIVGFGLMGMSAGYGNIDSDEERLKVLDRAWEIGATCWDTSDIYGDSEDVVGKWFKLHPERRADIFLATKFGLKLQGTGIVQDASPEYVLKAMESSLKRLHVDHIDLYYMHRADPAVPIEKTVGAMKQLVEEGKARHLGLSEVSSATLRRAHAIHPISAVQMEYSPWSLEAEGPDGTYLIDTCKELGASVFCYSPLGRGLTTGRYRSIDDFDETDLRRTMPRFQGENFQNNLAVVDKVKELAERKGCTPSQFVLAWLVAQGDNIFVIPGTKKIKYLEENTAAAFVTLSKEEIRELRELANKAEILGDRQSFFGSYADTAPLTE